MKKSTALKTLGLSENASEDDIKQAHRKLIIENHPDKFGQDPEMRAKTEEKTKLINEARDVLLNHSWEPEYSTAGTPFGAPYNYNPFATNQSSQHSSSQGNTTNNIPFDEWLFSESFVWTMWDENGTQHTYRTDYNPTSSAQRRRSGSQKTTSFFTSANAPFWYTSTANTQGSSSSQRSRPFEDPFTSSFFNFVNFFTQEPTWEEKLQQVRNDLRMDIKFIVAKALALLACALLSAPATGLHLYTIFSIGQGIWKRLKFLSLVFLIPFTMLAIIFAPSSNNVIGIFGLILFVFAIGFDISNVVRHIKRVRAIKRHIKEAEAS